MEHTKEEIERFLEWERMYLLAPTDRGRDYHPSTLVRGEGSYLWDQDGKRYLDFFSQTWNVNIGYGNRKVIEAIKRQAEEMPYLSPGKTSLVRVKLARKLMSLVPGNLAKCMFYNSGSEAVDTALKISKEYTRKPKFISRWYAYHGATQGALSATGLPARRTPYEPLLPGFIFVPPPYCFRCKFGLEYPGCGIRCVEFIEDTIRFENPETVAGVIAEPVMGSGGVIVPPPEYWPRLRTITQKHHILLIDDEVITGFGRTGKWFCVQHWGVEPDLMTLAKGISSGYTPVSATVVSKDIANFYETEPFMHFHTYQNHPLCLAAAVANIEVLEEEGLIENAAKVGKHLQERLKGLEEDHACVGQARGMGLLAAIELVKNKETREPFVEEDLFLIWKKYRPEQLVAEVAVGKAYSRGLILSAYKFANIIRICPPLCTTEDQVDDGVEILDTVLKEIDSEYLG
jgi:taurine--2-oxoglutarate transaminase